jgi:stage VI sporulation protein D
VETHAEEPSEEVNHATDTYQIDNAVTDTTQEVNHAADTYQIDNVVTDTYQEVNHAADTHQIDNAVTDTYQEVDRAKDTFSFEDDKVYTEDPFTPLYAFQPNKKTESKEEENPQNIASFFEKRKTKQKEAEVEQVVEIEAPDENSLSLTKIFAEEEGEELTRIKICIVQQGESIDHIAERYDVTIQQLIRINRLSTEDNVHDGQLLYIPVKAVSKT